MKAIKYLCTSFVIILLVVIKCYADDRYKEVEKKEIFSKLIIRKAEDKIYSGQIKSIKGLKDFISKYSLEIEIEIENIDFKKYMLIFSITDNITTRVDAFLKTKKKPIKYIFDYYQTDTKYKLRFSLEKGKVYSKEWIYKNSYSTEAGLKSLVFEYIEVWYNKKRRHSALGFLSPMQYKFNNMSLN